MKEEKKTGAFLSLKCCQPLKLLKCFHREFRSLQASNIEAVSQKAVNLRVHHRAVGTRGAQGHVPPQYFKQLVAVPLQYFKQILGLTKWVPPQSLTPSYGPAARGF